MLMLQPKTILHINVSRIGDTLLATPVIRALAHRWPDAAITCLGHPKRVELLEHLPFVAHVGGITKNTARWMGRLPGKQYDLAVVHGFDEALIWYALRVAHKVVAFKQADNALNQRLYRCIQRPVLDSVPAVDIQLALTNALEIEPAGRFLSFALSEQEQQAALARLQAASIIGRKPLIGLMVESFPTKPYRDWPIQHFSATAQQILQHCPSAHFLLFGGQLPAEKIQQMQRDLGDRITVYAGKLSLRETGSMMQKLDLYIGVDTGPTHLAGALGVPMIGLYHCLHRGKWLAPREHPKLVVLEHPVSDDECSAQRSMSEIGVDQVVPHALQLLGLAQ